MKFEAAFIIIIKSQSQKQCNQETDIAKAAICKISLTSYIIVLNKLGRC